MIHCEHPIIILHPYFRNRFMIHKIAVVNGNTVDLRLHSDAYINRHWHEIYRQYFSIPKIAPDPNDLDKYFIPCSDDSLPIYLAVPCGHCSLCRARYVNELSARCRCETFASPYKPLFITLTYDNAHLPSDGVSLDDCQRFLKRLRINLSRTFGHNISLRYVLASEYGHNTHRPHYHLILWNMPYFKVDDSNIQCGIAQTLGIRTNNAFVRSFDKLVQFIRDSWQNGFVSVQVAKDPSAKYLMKYIGKGSVVPPGKNKCFCTWSRRPGLGRLAYEQLKDVINTCDSTSLQLFDPKVGHVQNIHIPRYFVRLMCPCPSEVASKYKDLFHDFRFHYYAYMFHYAGHEDDQYMDVRQMYGDIQSIFYPFADTFSFSVDPYFTDKWEFEQFHKSIDWREDYAYWKFVAMYMDLLNLVPELSDYLESSLPWKERYTFIAAEESSSDKRTISEIKYDVELQNNKLCQKSLL